MDPDDFFKVLKSRRSIRVFTDRRPNHAQIEQLIEAASWAPSNHNRQGWRFIVYEDKLFIVDLAQRIRSSLKTSLQQADLKAAEHSDELIHFASVFENAPVIILALHKKSIAVGRSILKLSSNTMVSSESISTAMACQNLLLAAHAAGLAGCIMTAPLLAGEVWKSMELPAGFEPTCLIALGYAAGAGQMPKRKKLEHILEYR